MLVKMEKRIINNNLQSNMNLQMIKILIKGRKKIMLQMIFIMKDLKNSFVDINNLSTNNLFYLFANKYTFIYNNDLKLNYISLKII